MPTSQTAETLVQAKRELWLAAWSFFPLLALRGFTLATLWYWFLTPLGVPAVSLLQASGISLMFSFLQNSFNRMYGTTQNQKLAQVLAKYVASCVFVLMIGWLLQFCMRW